ncbi:GTPase-associated protein 1-related protein [Streptomyces sp. HGB0020]|jgi:hypothetical protein|uniref:GTPase-associated protein 1-related protein n=1 Tax=Streptomyces sp. HGB0020 TaxID=1078086 RepID=UPI00034E5ACF|nr:GTPase-associated protein 1-related protein [Streptomyces sp. HGB0020]EPD66483.1 hypothetical protein HMPREF1211_02007 [Streptomyces sp. HGB0020]
MAIRELSYVLRRDPASGADRFTPVSEVPEGVPDDLMQRVIAATHRAAPALGAALSYTRLPHRDGGGLLCSVRPDEESDGLRVDARYEAGEPEDDRRWPVDAFRRSTLDRDGGTGFAPRDWCWDHALLTKFASEQAARIAPFLADVRALFADPAGRQIVLAERDQETVARWIALACASLPVTHARALTFTTHCADPGLAPQQILGIGPDLDSEVFDRYDDSTVTHLFRVHDGLGGPGSPPRSDPWAELAARLWREGVVPRTDEHEAGDPFAVLPLARRALTARSGQALTGLPEEVLRAILSAAVRVAEQGPPDIGTAHDLADLARQIAEHRPDAVQPLAAALLRSRAKAADPVNAVPTLEAARADLPLDEGTWRTVRSEFGPPPEDELRRLLRQQPSTAWEKPLRVLLAAGGDRDRGSVLDEAEFKIARALNRPDQRRACADAVALLEALGDRALVRRILERLAEGEEERRIRALRDLAASPHGDWLRDHLDGAPRAVRLAASAGYRSRGAYGLTGVDLWIDLAHRHLEGAKVPDVPTLKILWTLAWPSRSGVVPVAEQSRITEVCSARLIVEAGHELSLAHWLRHPERIDERYLDLARATTDAKRLLQPEVATARLVVFAHDFARGEETLADAMERLPLLEERAGRLEGVLRERIDSWIARGVTRADPYEVHGTDALRRYAVGSMRLLTLYREAVHSARREGGALEARALCEPRRMAALFFAWAELHPGQTGAWHDLSRHLIDEVLGEALRHMDRRARSEVAAVLDGWGGQRWVQAWNQWWQSPR